MSALASPPLSDERRAAFNDYISAVRAFLLLGHWRIDLPDEWPEQGDDVIAGIDTCDGRYVATVRLGPSFWERRRDEQRDTIVHELLHLHHVRITDLVRLGEWRHQVGQGLYDALAADVKREAEYMTDALTSVIGEHAPLPPETWPA